MAPPELITVAAAYGLVLGSFLNVVVHRVPRQMSVLAPRSHCPACGRLIRWFDNLPVLSWLLLRGRCRRCGARISVRYPLVELATGLLLAAVADRFGVSVQGAAALVFGALLLALALIDLEHFLLPDVLTLPGIAAGMLFSLAGGLVRPLDALIGAALGAMLPYAVIVLYRLVRGVEGMGLGDVKLLAMIGAFIGWQGALLTLCVGACAGAVVGIGLVFAGRGKADTELPFGTFLSAAALLVLFVRAPLLTLFGWGRW